MSRFIVEQIKKDGDVDSLETYDFLRALERFCKCTRPTGLASPLYDVSGEMTVKMGDATVTIRAHDFLKQVQDSLNPQDR